MAFVGVSNVPGSFDATGVNINAGGDVQIASGQQATTNVTSESNGGGFVADGDAEATSNANPVNTVAAVGQNADVTGRTVSISAINPALDMTTNATSRVFAAGAAATANTTNNATSSALAEILSGADIAGYQGVDVVANNDDFSDNQNQSTTNVSLTFFLQFGGTHSNTNFTTQVKASSGADVFAGPRGTSTVLQNEGAQVALYVDADDHNFHSGASSETRNVAWDANVTITSGQDVKTLIVGPDGSILQETNLTATVGGGVINVSNITAQIGWAVFQSQGGVTDSTTPTFTFEESLEKVTIINESANQLDINNITVYTPSSSQPTVKLLNGSNYTFNIDFTLPATTVDIENTNPTQTSSAIQLQGLIDNPVGTTTIVNSRGAILSTGANAILRTNDLTLTATGDIGSLANPVNAELVQFSNLSNGGTLQMTSMTADSSGGSVYLDLRGRRRDGGSGPFTVDVNSITAKDDINVSLETSVQDSGLGGTFGGVDVFDPSDKGDFFGNYPANNGTAINLDPAVYSTSSNSNTIASTYAFPAGANSANGAGLVAGGSIIMMATNGGALDPLTSILGLTDLTGSGSLYVTTNGDITLTESGGGAMTLQKAASLLGNVTLTVPDLLSAGQDLHLVDDGSITAGGNVLLRVGDNIDTGAASTIAADGTVTIDGDFGNADAGVGSTMTFQGTLNGSTITINGGPDDDVITLDRTTVLGPTQIFGSAGDDTINIGGFMTGNGLLSGLQAGVTVDGGAGTNVLNIDDSGDTANTTDGVLSGTGLTGLGMGVGISYSNTFENLNVLQGSGNDAFTIHVGAVSLPPITVVDGGPGTNTLAATFADDFDGSLTLIRYGTVSGSIGNNFNGNLIVEGPSTITSLTVGGSVNPTGSLVADNVTSMTIGPDQYSPGHDMQGEIILSGTLGDLRVAGGTPGLIEAQNIGTIRVYGGYGPYVADIIEAGMQRFIEANVTDGTTCPPLPPAYPLPPLPMSPTGIHFQYYYESGTLTDPQATIRATDTNVPPGQDVYDLSLVVYSDTAKFNLARFDATTQSGVGNVAVEGDLLNQVTAGASSFFLQPGGGVDTDPAGIYLPLDHIVGVAISGHAFAGTVTVAGLQGIALGSLTDTRGIVDVGSAIFADAAMGLVTNPHDSFDQAHETFRIPFSDTRPVAFFLDTEWPPHQGALDPFGFVFNQLTLPNNTRGAVVAFVTTAIATDPAGDSGTIIPTVTLCGDGGGFDDGQPIFDQITSTGPLGNINVSTDPEPDAAPFLNIGLPANVCAPSILGSIDVITGPISGIIQTTGMYTDPITMVESYITPVFGQVITTPGNISSEPPTYTVTTVQATAITGEIISRGDLISQVISDSDITGAIAAQGNIGIVVAGHRLGGVVANGNISGNILTLEDILGDIDIGGDLSGRIAAHEEILSDINIGGIITASGAIFSQGRIGVPSPNTNNLPPATGLNVSAVDGIVAAEGDITNIRVGTTDISHALYYQQDIPSCSITGDTLDGIFTDEGEVLTFGTSCTDLSGLDLMLQNKDNVTTDGQGNLTGTIHYHTFQVTGLVSPVPACATQTVTVSVLDFNGNLFPGYLGTVHFADSAGGATLPADYAFTAGDAGVHNFPMTFMTLGSQTLTVTDVATGCVLGQITITVVPGATAGFIVEVTPSTVMTCDTATVTIEAVDACGNITPNYTGTIHFTSSDLLAALPGNYTFLSSDHGVATFSVTFNTAAIQTLTVTDTQQPTLTGSKTGIVVFNCVPVITSLNPPSGSECTQGASFELMVFGTDFARDAVINFNGTALVTTFVSSTEVEATVPAYCFDEVCMLPVTVTNPPLGGGTSNTLQFILNQYPIDVTAVPFTATENQPFSGEVATFIDTDLTPHPASIYTATITWGDGQTSIGTVTSDCHGGFIVTGTNTYGISGEVPVSITVEDVGCAIGTATENIPVADAPITAQGSCFVVTQSLTVGPINLGVFADQGSAKPLADLSATINWGDGSAPSVGTVTISGQTYTVSGSHTYATGGVYLATITLTDTTGTTVITHSGIDVDHIEDLPLTATASLFTPTENAGFTGAVATFTDADPTGQASEYSATIAWGDGQSSTGSVTSNGQGGFTVSGSHTYTAQGPETVTVTINDVGGASTTITEQITVADAPIVGVGLPVPNQQPATIVGLPLAAFTDSGAPVTADQIVTSINWGDGSVPSAGTVTIAGNVYTVAGSHTYSQGGAYTLTITLLATDGGSSVTTTTSLVVLNNPELPLIVNFTPFAPTEFTSFSGQVADFTDANSTATTAADYTATIMWGDGQNTNGTIAPDGHGGFTVSGSHEYTAFGSMTFSVVVQHTGGLAGSVGVGLSVADAAFTGTGITVLARQNPSLPLADVQLAQFTHPGTPAELASALSATVDWGDGTTSPAQNITLNDEGEYIVTGSHQYATSGVFTIKVTISDGFGGTGSATTQVQVLNVPFSGSAMAIVANPSLPLHNVQLATFGHSGAAEPLGNLQAMVNWGDGTSAPAASIALDSAGNYVVSGIHTYTTGGVFKIAVTLSDLAGTTGTVSTQVQVDDNALWVQDAYEQLLNRPADPAGLANFQQILDTGRLQSLAPIAAEFVTSTEYRSDLITGYYQEFLGRKPSQAEVNSWVGLLQQGETEEQVINFFASSPEFFQAQGSSNSQWLNELYNDLLGRNPDPGSANFLNALNAGGARSTVVNDILNSGEFAAREITTVYTTYLGRTPTTADVSYWAPILEQSGHGAGQPSPDDSFLISVLSSAEYLNKSGGTDQSWFQSVYSQVLGRSPDPTGLNNTLAQLLNGYAQQRDAVASALIGSQEYRGDQVVSYYQAFLGRTPSASEIAGWVSGTANEDQIITAIASSPESLQHLGGTNESWIDAVYQQLLGRTRASSDLGLLSGLENGTFTRAQVVTTILDSSEYETRLVDSYYSNYLGRQPESGEIASELQSLQSGTSQDALLAAILSSSEEFKHAVV